MSTHDTTDTDALARLQSTLTEAIHAHSTDPAQLERAACWTKEVAHAWARGDLIGGDMSGVLVALAMACHDDSVWHTLANVRQRVLLERDPFVARVLAGGGKGTG